MLNYRLMGISGRGFVVYVTEEVRPQMTRMILLGAAAAQ